MESCRLAGDFIKTKDFKEANETKTIHHFSDWHFLSEIKCATNNHNRTSRK